MNRLLVVQLTHLVHQLELMLGKSRCLAGLYVYFREKWALRRRFSFKRLLGGGQTSLAILMIARSLVRLLRLFRLFDD